MRNLKGTLHLNIVEVTVLYSAKSASNESVFYPAANVNG